MQAHRIRLAAVRWKIFQTIFANATIQTDKRDRRDRRDRRDDKQCF